MNKILFISSSRADYGLLREVIIKTQKINKETYLMVTGSHLSKEFGETISEIKKDKIKNIIRKKILDNKFQAINISNYIQRAIMETSDVLKKLKPSALVVLGDRYEILGCVVAATIFRIPIVHLHGGELTLGAFDNSIRHSISKLSHLHFPIHDHYKRRLIQLGEDPKTIFNYGSIGSYSLKNTKLLTRKQLERLFKIKLNKKIILSTFHPVTLEVDKAKLHIQNLIKFLKLHNDKIVIFTSPNFDNETQIIKKEIQKFTKKNSYVYFYNSLGRKAYLSFMKIAHLVIGNSSSGVLESPFFGTKTINIGDRQKGRIQSDNIINCDYKFKSIIRSYFMIQNKPKKKSNIFYKKNTPNLIAKKILNFKFNLKKKFYDFK